MQAILFLVIFGLVQHYGNANVLPQNSSGLLSDNGVLIVGGQPAGDGQFPYQVSLRINNQHFCGGSLISPLSVLTAAHCIYGVSTVGMTVVAGTNVLSSGGEARAVVRAVYHSAYDPQTTINDIGMLHLNAPFVPIINPKIGLIVPSLVQLPPLSGVVLSGWGLTSYPGDIPNNLQYINLNTIDLQTCANALAGANPITNGHICTLSPFGQGACQGDSGGPLVDRVLGTQVGIVSWGIPCAKGLPDVFTNVAFYNAWIVANILT